MNLNVLLNLPYVDLSPLKDIPWKDRPDMVDVSEDPRYAFLAILWAFERQNYFCGITFGSKQVKSLEELESFYNDNLIEFEEYFLKRIYFRKERRKQQDLDWVNASFDEKVNAIEFPHYLTDRNLYSLMRIIYSSAP